MTRTLLIAVLLFTARVDAATLYVNNSGSPSCSDNTAKASNDAAHPWCSIGRATWGNASRSSASSSEAAAAGDTVLVTGGVYTASDQCSPTEGVCWHDVFYNPTNNGSAGNYITFSCVGTCDIYLPSWNGPAMGADDKSYIKWFADVTLGYKWRMQSYNKLDNLASSTQVNTTGDTGPVVCFGAASTGCWLEGFDLDGGPAYDHPSGDNYTGIRIQFCDDCVIRNNKFRNFRTTIASHGYAINTYMSERSIIEHNDIGSSDVCYSVKDNPIFTDRSSAYFRFNKCDGAVQCFLWSIQTNDFTVVTQNICANATESGVRGTGLSASGVDVINNTFYNVPTIISYGVFASSRFFNNASVTSNRVLYNDSGAAFANYFTLQHNDTGFNAIWYFSGDANQTLTTFNANHANQNDVNPVSIEVDPLLVNPAQGDYRICTGNGTPSASCQAASPAINLGVDVLDLDHDGSTTDAITAGAYVTAGQTEQIGLETTAAPTASTGPIPQFSRKLRKAF